MKTFYQSYIRHPEAVSAKRVHNIQFDQNGVVLPYAEWVIDTKEYVDTEVMGLMATGCGGVVSSSLSLQTLE